MELLNKIEVRIGERVPLVFEKKDHFIVKIDDMYRMCEYRTECTENASPGDATVLTYLPNQHR